MKQVHAADLSRRSREQRERSAKADSHDLIRVQGAEGCPISLSFLISALLARYGEMAVLTRIKATTQHGERQAQGVQ